MSSDNPTSGDDQQETASTTFDPWWVVGFVDGEGCFSVSIHHNSRFALRTRGWQIAPVFHAYQHENSRRDPPSTPRLLRLRAHPPEGTSKFRVDVRRSTHVVTWAGASSRSSSGTRFR